IDVRSPRHWPWAGKASARPEARRRLASAPRSQSLGARAGGRASPPLTRAPGMLRRGGCPFVSLAARVPLVLCFAALACGERAGPRAPGADDFGEEVRPGTPARPARIVSLSPATTELLWALGAGRRLVGRTHWDTYPDSARAVPDLGPGIRPNVEAVLATHP